MRLFAAVVRLRRSSTTSPSSSSLARGRSDLRWTSPDQWHLTMAFMPSVPERPGRADRAAGPARRAAPTAAAAGGRRGRLPQPVRRTRALGGHRARGGRAPALARGTRSVCAKAGRRPRAALPPAPDTGPAAPARRGDALAAGAGRLCRPRLDLGRGHHRVAPRRGSAPHPATRCSAGFRSATRRPRQDSNLRPRD